MHTAEEIRGVYVITDAVLRPDRSHVEIARAAVQGGSRVIQLRDKEASDSELIPIAREIRRITAEAGAIFIVNDRIEVALASDADGLHIGQEDMPVADARKRWPERLLGVSVGSPEEAVTAERDGADHLGVGPIYSTSTKLDAGAATGLELIGRIRQVCRLPMVAIGGIGLSNIAEVARAGAESATMISAIVCADDMVAATRALVEAWGRWAVTSDQSKPPLPTDH